MFKVGKDDGSSVFGYVTIGLMMGQVGPVMSAASDELGIQAATIGHAISIYYGASILGIILGFYLIRNLGKEFFLLLGSLLLVLSYVFAIWVQSTSQLLILTTFTGIGLGFYQIGINSLAVDRSSAYSLGKQAGRLAFLQFFFGVGAVISPLIVDACHLQLENWRWSYLIVMIAGPLFMTMILASDIRRQKNDPKSSATSPDLITNKPVRASVWTPLLILLLVVASVYTMLETSMFNWLSYYWDTRYIEGLLVTGAKASSVFWLMFSLSRAGMGVFVERIGAWNALMLFSGLILVLCLVWSALNPVWWALLGIVILVGLLMGCTFPTIMVIVSRRQKGDSSGILTIFFVLTTATAAIAPLGIGSIVKQMGVTVFPWILAGLGVAFIISLGYARRVRSRMKEQES